MEHGKFDFDVAVLGGGSAGYAAARTAASAGLKTVVIEGGREVGGLCILRGCMPTKALLHAADVLHTVQRAGTWGLKAENVGHDFAAVMARKDAMIEDFASYRRQQLTGGKFEFIRANARFTDPHTVALDTGRSLTAKNFVLSTGSVVAEPPLPQLKDAGYFTSDDALALAKLPRSLIVLGGGAVGVEFAQFFQRFGVQVTLVQRSPHILRDFDTDAAEVLEKVFRREGMQVFTNTKLYNAGKRFDSETKFVAFQHDEKYREFTPEEAAKAAEDRKRLPKEFQPSDKPEIIEVTPTHITIRSPADIAGTGIGSSSSASIEADEILFALGRAPNTVGLGLANTGVRLDGHSRILTNEHQRTSAPHIYAAGDCCGPHEIVHIAIQQGEIAAHNIAHPDRPRAMDYRLLTHVVFTDPQIGCVGLTEKAARAAGVPYLAASYPFADHGKSLIMEAKDGFVKLLADPKSGEILGGCCVGPMGGELIHEIVAAMAKRMTVHELAAMPHYHPTLAEIWTYPAEELAEKI